MAISYACPKCGLDCKAPDGSTGKKAKCPNCQHIFRIDGPQLPQSDDLPPRVKKEPVKRGPYWRAGWLAGIGGITVSLGLLIGGDFGGAMVFFGAVPLLLGLILAANSGTTALQEERDALEASLPKKSPDKPAEPLTERELLAMIATRIGAVETDAAVSRSYLGCMLSLFVVLGILMLLGFFTLSEQVRYIGR